MNQNDSARSRSIEVTVRDLNDNFTRWFTMELGTLPSAIREELKLGEVTVTLQPSSTMFLGSPRSESETSAVNSLGRSTEKLSKGSKFTLSLSQSSDIYWLCATLERR